MRKVLITGATGVLGSALAPLFINEPETQVLLLIRAGDDRVLAQRLEALFAFWGADIAEPGARSRVTALRGDAAEPGFGLPRAVGDGLARDLTHIVHCAASVRLDLSEGEARRSALDPARHAVALAAACRGNGRFAKLDYVSTLGVAGRLQGMVPERPLTEARGFHNTYESAKAAAEELVLAAAQDGLPVTIHRPSMVVGHSRTGKISRFQVFYFLSRFLSGRHTWGLIPRLEGMSLDLVPCDWVAGAIHRASLDGRTVGRILHLCAGPDRAVPFLDLVRILGEHYRRRELHLPRLRLVPPRLFLAALVALRLIAHGDSRHRLGNLEMFLDYMADRQVFANRETLRLLGYGGDDAPPAPATFLTPVLEYSDNAWRERERSRNPADQTVVVGAGRNSAGADTAT